MILPNPSIGPDTKPELETGVGGVTATDDFESELDPPPPQLMRANALTLIIKVFEVEKFVMSYPLVRPKAHVRLRASHKTSE